MTLDGSRSDAVVVGDCPDREFGGDDWQPLAISESGANADWIGIDFGACDQVGEDETIFFHRDVDVPFLATGIKINFVTYQDNTLEKVFVNGNPVGPIQRGVSGSGTVSDGSNNEEEFCVDVRDDCDGGTSIMVTTEEGLNRGQENTLTFMVREQDPLPDEDEVNFTGFIASGQLSYEQISGPPQPSPAPALGQWGLTFLMLMMAGFGLLALRRR